MKSLTSKAISELTGISIPTLRYYEQIGLLDSIKRAENGHRCYTEDDLRRIDFLKRLRATGMSIREMQYYVTLYRAGEATIIERRLILEAHRQAVQAQIDTLTDTLAFLDAKITRYRQEEARHIEQQSIPTESKDKVETK